MQFHTQYPYIFLLSPTTKWCNFTVTGYQHQPLEKTYTISRQQLQTRRRQKSPVLLTFYSTNSPLRWRGKKEGEKKKKERKREKEKKKKRKKNYYTQFLDPLIIFQQYYAELHVEIRFTCNRQTIQLRRAGTSLKFNECRSFAGLLACACRVKLCRNKSGRVNRACPPSLRDTLPATPVSRG